MAPSGIYYGTVTRADGFRVWVRVAALGSSGTEFGPCPVPDQFKIGDRVIVGQISGYGDRVVVLQKASPNPDVVSLNMATEVNQLLVAGFYGFVTDAIASSAYDLPMPYAGVLEVQSTLENEVITQTYTAWRNQAQVGTSIWTRTRKGTTWSSWIPLLNNTGLRTSTGALQPDDFLPGSKWAIQTASFEVRARRAFVYVHATRTTSALQQYNTGNVANETFMTLQEYAVAWGAVPTIAKPQPLTNGDIGRMLSATINNAGVIKLNAVGGSADIAVGESVSVSGWYEI